MKLRSGLNQMRLNLSPGESARIRYVLRCPLRGHYSIGPVSLRSSNTFNLGVEEMFVDHHSDIVIFPQIKEVEEAFLRSRTPKMYTGATTLRTPGQGSEFYSLREYVAGDPFKNINWKAYARTGELMVNEKCRDAVTDLYLLIDSRDISRIGTVLKNPLEMSTVSAASLAAFFLKRRDFVALGIYGEKLSYLPPDTGDKQYFKILSALAGVTAKGEMPLQAVTNSLMADLAVAVRYSSYLHVRAMVLFLQQLETLLDVATKLPFFHHPVLTLKDWLAGYQECHTKF